MITASGADLSRAHLVGAGGAGMSAIGLILLDRGAVVSGSDAKASHALTGLTARGARTAIGQRAENLDLVDGGPTAVVASTAIRPDNAELVEARRRGIPVVRRAEALAALMNGARGVCVAGTHGKTSTTSMLTVALLHAGLDPSFAIGGELNESGTGAHAGRGEIFVAEADESDGSFLEFAPAGAIITTIEPDHLDYHHSPEAYAAVFRQFAGRITPGGFLVAGVDDPGVRDLLDALGADPGVPAPEAGRVALPGDGRTIRVITYGRADAADVQILRTRASGTSGAVTVRLPDGRTVAVTVGVPGDHMLANATAALVTGLQLGVPADAMVAGLAGYTGVRRRFDFRGRVGDIRVYDDYAHHPTEVAATLSAARAVAGTGRVVVVFQPHLYSRTEMFAAAFARALTAADVVVVLDVYGAREDPRPGVTGDLIVREMPASSGARFVPSLARVPEVVGGLARPGDVILTMGAGDVTMLAPEILAALGARGDEARGRR